MVPFESMGTVSYSPTIVTMAVSVAVCECDIFSVKEWPDLETGLGFAFHSHSRSLKVLVVSFESLGTVSYSPSIVTMAVSAAILEIFSVKEWPDLEMWVWGPSRSLKMARFDRPCITSY